MRAHATWRLSAVLVLALVGAAAAAPNREKLITGALASENGKAMAQLLGEPTARAVVELICDRNLGPSWDTLDDARALAAVGVFVGIEVANVRDIKQTIDGLLQRLRDKTLAQVVDTDKLDPVPGTAATDPPALRAARWIAGASNSVRDPAQTAATVAALLTEYTSKKYAAGDYNALKILNKLLVVDLVGNVNGFDVVLPAQRSVVVESPMPSSIAGARLLEQALAALAALPPTLVPSPAETACYLFAVIVRCHGFIDANGRTARAAYALALLSKASAADFVAITPAGERKLTGLP